MSCSNIKRCFIIFVGILALTGCGSSKSETKLESYAVSGEEVSESENRYTYLTSINLKKDNANLRVYLPDGESPEKSESKASSSMDGVTVETELITDDNGANVSSISETEFITRQTEISQLAGIQDITDIPESTGDSFSIRQIGYNINDGSGTIFPCTVIIKADHIQDTYFLKTVITVDNSQANEEAKSILKEIMDAYGLSLS